MLILICFKLQNLVILTQDINKLEYILNKQNFENFKFQIVYNKTKFQK